MKKTVIALLALVLPTCAFAQLAPAAPPSPSIAAALRTAGIPPQPGALTVAECLTILGGLNQLDGHQVVINAGKPNESVVTVSYVFGNAALRRIIQEDIVALQSVQKTAQTLQIAIFKENVKDGTEIKPNTPEMEAYNKQINDASIAACPANVTHIRLADLKLEQNEIAGTILAALDKILDK